MIVLPCKVIFKDKFRNQISQSSRFLGKTINSLISTENGNLHRFQTAGSISPTIESNPLKQIHPKRMHLIDKEISQNYTRRKEFENATVIMCPLWPSNLDGFGCNAC